MRIDIRVGEVVVDDDEAGSEIAGELGEGVEDLVVVIGHAHDALLDGLPARAVRLVLLAIDLGHDLDGDRVGGGGRHARIGKGDRREAQKALHLIAAGIAIGDGDVGDGHVGADVLLAEAQARRAGVEKHLARRSAADGDSDEIVEPVSLGIWVQWDGNGILCPGPRRPERHAGQHQRDTPRP
jgi:hypothetical protein